MTGQGAETGRKRDIALSLSPVCSGWVSEGAGPGQCSRRCRPGREELHALRSQPGYLRIPSDRWTAPSTSHARSTKPSHLGIKKTLFSLIRGFPDSSLTLL